MDSKSTPQFHYGMQRAHLQNAQVIGSQIQQGHTSPLLNQTYPTEASRVQYAQGNHVDQMTQQKNVERKHFVQSHDFANVKPLPDPQINHTLNQQFEMAQNGIAPTVQTSPFLRRNTNHGQVRDYNSPLPTQYVPAVTASRPTPTYTAQQVQVQGQANSSVPMPQIVPLHMRKR